MKLKKIVLFGLTLVFAGTATALAACETDSGSKQPPEYTIEDGRPNGELAAPDEGFAIDGVLDEAAYEDIRWLEGPVLRPYYTSDGQGVYYDYDVIRAQTEKAAQVKMGTYYGEKGVYIAYSFKEQAGKVCYVNPSRRAYRNSGVELHIGIPSSLTMTGDETISRLTVNANGALSIAKTQGDIWMAPYGTEDPANMPYVGLTGNGTRTDENADRTEFTFELFLPWGYFDEVGGEGTAQSMKEGGDLVVAPGVITANNYTGSGQTDREYYVISARLDDGAWSDPQGWYHFNRGGYEGYGITVKAAQNGTVQEWMGYDTAPKNSSVVFVTKADEGYALKEFRVNGAAVPNDHIHYDMYTTLGARAESSAQKAYIRIPEDEIAGDISVEAVFEPLDAGEQTLVATIYGESRENVLTNTKVTFTRGDTAIEGVTDGNGVLTLSGLTSGLYDVAVDNLTYRGFDDFVFFSAEKHKEIVFEKNALSLEGSENISSNYLEIYGKIGSVADGFVFSGFFGFEGADYDELVNFTNTVYFITDKASGEQFGFRFTKWGNYLMLKCEGAEYHFEGDAQAVEYFKQEKGVHFMFAVDSEGNIAVYMRRSDTEWINLSTSGSVRFPVEKEIMAVNFAKQDDGSAKHVATLRDGSITVGTSRVDLPVDITLNGGAEVTGGRVEIPSDIVLGDRVTVTLTPERYYGVQALKVNGAIVDCVEENGVYTYTFTAEKQSYAIEASFERIAGDFSVVLTIAPSLTGAADDLRVVLVGGSVQYEAVRGAGNVWTAEGLAYGRYSVVVSSKSGGYTVARGNAVFSAENGSTTLSVTADNYGDDRTYALEGESDTEGGIVIAEGLGATAQGFVYEGFLGVGGAGDLNNIGDKNYAAALRFTTASGDQFRLCFYIWSGKYWLIKAFREGQENTAASHEFAFTDNTALIDYVKRENGITVTIVAEPDGTLTVYAMTSSSEWLLIGEWQSPFAVTSPIEKVEVLRMFQSGIEGWTAKAEGELRFGTSDADIPVTITGAGSLTGGTVGVSRADIGDTVTLTITPAEGYALSGLQLDGSDVEWTDNKDGTYSYTFTAVKSRYALTVAFGVLSDLAIEVDVSAVPDAADDLVLRLENKAGEEIALTQSGAAWTAEDIPYGSYTLIVGSKSGSYTVLREEIAFSAENESVTLTVTADNYGDNRVYTLEGETDQESGVVIAKDLGATEEGFVFTGFLGVGGAGALSNIGDKNYAAALRFTTASGDQFRLCFYIWNGKYWLIKAFREGQENTAASHEFAFTDNTALIDYVKQKDGITVTIVAEPDGTLTVYAKTSDAEWTSIGEWQSPFAVTSPIEKVEVLRMFQNGLEGWTARVDGELRFGTTDTGIPVTITGAGSVTGGTVGVSEASLGGTVTVTLTPEENYILGSLKVDGSEVSCEEQDGVYTYTFTASKMVYSVEAAFVKAAGTYTVNVTIAGGTAEASDLEVVLTNGSISKTGVLSGDDVWTVEGLAYGGYTLIVSSKSGSYTVLREEIAFSAENESVTVSVTADNYGDNRVYTLEGETDQESGVVIAKDLGATAEGFVFTGFLGVGGAGALSNIGDKNYAAGLRFTTASGDQFRLCFYIWNGKYWLIKAFREGQENASGQSHEFAFTGNTALIDYVKQENGITVTIVAEPDGTLTVYAKTSDAEWTSIGEWQSPFAVTSPIEKVEVLRMFQNGLEGWTARVDGELRFGTTDTGIPVTITGAGSVTGGTVDVSEASLGGMVTVTLTPEENYILGSLKVDGSEVSCEEQDGAYTYTFTAFKMVYSVEAAFVKAAGTYTVNVTIAGGTAEVSDLEVVLTNGSISKTGVLGADNVWTVEGLAYGSYTLIVSSKSGGYTVLSQQVEFTEGNGSVTVSVTADNYGDNRVYTLEGETDQEDGDVIAEDLGATEEGFVFTGFLGVGGAGDLNNIGDKNYAAGLRFTTASGGQFRLCFYIWNGKYWLIKAFREGQENASGQSHEFAFTGNTALIDYVKQKNGITVTIVAEPDGTLTVYAMTNDTTWTSIGEWESPFAVTSPIEKVEVLRMFQNGLEGWTAKVDGELRFGTTDAGIPAVNVLTETIDLDKNGEVYWEHYSSGNGAENDPTVTDMKAGAEDRIVFDPSEWDRYETRPYGADNAQAFVGTSQNGALNSKGFVFRDQSNALTATVTLSKGDTAVKVYTGTWIPDCGFTISLTDVDGNVVGSIGFTVNNNSATYETVFTIDTSGWSEGESRTFTLTCGSTNTLKLMAIAIS